jgi:hypothetical protein
VTVHLELDHLVYAVPELDRAIEEFGARLGVTPRFGGQHEGLGTHNAILPLTGGTYVELMAPIPDWPVSNPPRPFGLDTLEDSRLVTWAVRSRNIKADVERATLRGYDPGIVLEMSRKQPDGEILDWKLSLRAEPLGDGLVPFVIDWGTAIHPAVSSDGGTARCALSDFSAKHPDPQPVREAINALGAELSIDESSTYGLCARLTGPAGSYELK